MSKMMTDEEFENDIKKYNELNKDTRFQVNRDKFFKCMYDKYESNAEFNTEYVAQSVWGARKIKADNPEIHYAVGADIGGLISHLLCFRKNIVLIDIRPIDRNIDGITYLQMDAVHMQGIADNSIESLSAMSSLEHFGLGRYGDKIDPDAWFKGLKTFVRVLKEGGKLYLSVPIEERDGLIFNIGRVFDPCTIIESLPEMKLLEMSGTVGRNSVVAISRDENDECIYDDNALDLMGAHTMAMFEFIKL